MEWKHAEINGSGLQCQSRSKESNMICYFIHFSNRKKRQTAGNAQKFYLNFD